MPLGYQCQMPNADLFFPEIFFCLPMWSLSSTYSYNNTYSYK